MTSLFRQHFFVLIYRAFAESLASENSSRLTSMQAAEKNIEDYINNLQRQYRHLRQSLITEELLDITVSYEKLEKG